MVGSLWLNMDPGGCPGIRVMTFFVFYVGPHFPNIQYFDVCGHMKAYKAIWTYMEVYGGVWSIWRYMEVYEGI